MHNYIFIRIWRWGSKQRWEPFGSAVNASFSRILRKVAKHWEWKFTRKKRRNMLCRKLLCIRFNFIVSKLLISLTSEYIWAFLRNFELAGLRKRNFPTKGFRVLNFDYEKSKMHRARRISAKMQTLSRKTSGNKNVFGLLHWSNDFSHQHILAGRFQRCTIFL